jgi:quercetin dioxygenase-like cupin family protein
MHYRYLIPDRLGGGLIASHIRIPDGGPVPDMVHYHSIQFQMIYCLRGWVRLVYEDQGPPFILNAGDCVTQPPEIRHRVLEASDELEVIEIGLPTGRHDPGRVFEGQTFCHHIAATAAWEPWGPEGLMEQDTGIKAASGGIADVRVLRLGDTIVQTAGPASDWVRFHYALTGEGVLEIEGRSGMPLSPGDVFVLPPGTDAGYRATTPTLELLLVAL